MCLHGSVIMNGGRRLWLKPLWPLRDSIMLGVVVDYVSPLSHFTSSLSACHLFLSCVSLLFWSAVLYLLAALHGRCGIAEQERRWRHCRYDQPSTIYTCVCSASDAISTSEDLRQTEHTLSPSGTVTVTYLPSSPP